MARERKFRDKIDKDEHDLLEPIDVLSLGSDNDPCFGKLHDLKAPECRECGDSEFCAIVKAQNLHKDRLNIENQQRFKDIEEADKDMVRLKRQAKNLITQYKAEGKPRIKSILLIARQLSISKDIVKEIYEKTI